MFASLCTLILSISCESKKEKKEEHAKFLVTSPIKKDTCITKDYVAQNEVKARKGEYLPFVGYGAGAEVEKVGEYTRNGAVEKNLEIKEWEEFPEPLTDYSAGLFASWELDV
jgi:hypothetical protein